MSDWGYGAALGRGISEGLMSFGKGYMDVLNTNERLGMDRNQALLSQQSAMMKMQEYTEGLKPLSTADLQKQMAPETWQPIYNVAKNLGIVKGEGQNEYIQKREWNELGENLKKNSIAQANILTQSMSILDKERAGHQVEFKKRDDKIREFEASTKFEWEEIQREASEKSKKLNKTVPISFDKKQAIEKKVAEFKGQGLYEEREKYREIITNITDKHFRAQHQLGVLDDAYKKDMERYGKETALNIHSGLLSRQAAEEQYQRDQWETKYKIIASNDKIRQALIGERQEDLENVREANRRTRPAKPSTKTETPYVGESTNRPMKVIDGRWEYTDDEGGLVPRNDRPSKISAKKAPSESKSFLDMEREKVGEKKKSGNKYGL